MIQTNHLTKKFLNKVALNNISFDVEPGKIYALLGPNGSGKTTWMKIVSGLTKPTSGEVLFEGHPVGIADKSAIAYMPTESYFYDWMKIKDVGIYYDDFFEDFSFEKFTRLIEKMELDMNSKVTSLSSGMNAKLRIAVTLSRDAKLFLLDEPLNGIDLIARDAIMETIISSASDDVTMIVSSHLVEELERFVNAGIFIHNGEVLDVVDVEELRVEKNVSLADHYRAIMR